MSKRCQVEFFFFFPRTIHRQLPQNVWYSTTGLSCSVPWDLRTCLAHFSTLWWEILSERSRPLAPLQWSVKYSSINHLWLLKEANSWPPEIIGFYLGGAGGVGGCVRMKSGGKKKRCWLSLQWDCAPIPWQCCKPDWIFRALESWAPIIHFHYRNESCSKKVWS